MKPDKDNPKPLYKQIYESLKKDIETGKLKNGTILPSENEMAENFGVSRITVRLALADIQKENYIKRVRSYGTEVIYNPEKKRDSNAIAVISVDIRESFFSEILHGIYSVLDKENYKLILFDTKNDSEKEKEYLIKYRDLVAGFIVAPAIGNRNHGHYGELLSQRIPFVFVDRYLPEFNVPRVCSDNRLGGYLAARHLLQLGHRRIAVLCEPEATSTAERISGYRQAFGEQGLEAAESLVFTGNKRSVEQGYNLASEIIDSYYPGVTAAFCINDNLALGCLKRLDEEGIDVPEEFSVVGFDNLDFTQHLTPPLTTVNQPRFLMGQKAAEIVVGKIRGLTNGESLSLPVELVVRGSTARKYSSKRIKVPV